MNAPIFSLKLLNNDELSDASDLSIRKIESRLGLCNDNATVLLVAFEWNERFILDNWDIPNRELVRKSGVSLNFRSVSEEAQCCECGIYKLCQTRGCNHFLCDLCLKEYAQRRIQAGDLNMKCPQMTCERMVVPSQFLTLVSPEDKDFHKLGLRRSYARSKARDVNKFARIFDGLQNFISRQVKGPASFIWRHKLGFATTLISAFVVCYMFCGGGTMQCFGVLSLVNVTSRYGLWGRIMEFVVTLLLLNHMGANLSFLATIALFSAGTAFLIFTLIAMMIRRLSIAMWRMIFH